MSTVKRNGMIFKIVSVPNAGSVVSWKWSHDALLGTRVLQFLGSMQVGMCDSGQLVPIRI